jgi:hypothetical protein
VRRREGREGGRERRKGRRRGKKRREREKKGMGEKGTETGDGRVIRVSIND